MAETEYKREILGVTNNRKKRMLVKLLIGEMTDLRNSIRFFLVLNPSVLYQNCVVIKGI